MPPNIVGRVDFVFAGTLKIMTEIVRRDCMRLLLRTKPGTPQLQHVSRISFCHFTRLGHLSSTGHEVMHLSSIGELLTLRCLPRISSGRMRKTRSQMPFVQ